MQSISPIHRLLIIAGIVALTLSACRGGSGTRLLPPTSGGRHALTAAIAPAQWTSGNAGSPATITVSFPNAPAVGDTLVVVLWNNAQNNCAANTYTPPSGWTLIDQNQNQYCSTYQAFSHIVGSGESNAYGFTPLAAQRYHVWIGADIAGGAGVDQASNTAQGSGTTTWTTPSLTPSQSGDLALAFQLPYTLSSLTWTNPPSWNLGTGPTSSWRGEAATQTLSSTAAVSESSTSSVSAYGFSVLVLVAPSGAPPPTPPPTPAPTPSSTGAPGSAPSPLQWTSGQAGLSIIVSFPSTPTVGDTLLVALWNNAQKTCAPNTYTPPAGWTLADQNLSAYCETYQTFSHVVASGETNSYVFTPTVVQRTHVWIGVDVANAAGVDKASSAVDPSGTTSWATPMLTPSQSNDLAVVFQMPYTLSLLNWTNPSGWNLGTGPTSTWRGEGLSQQLATAAAVSETSTSSVSAYGFSATVLLKGGNAPPATPPPTVTYTDWNTFGDTLQRTGFNSQESTVSASNAGSLQMRWSTDLGAPITAQPILATNVTLPNGTAANVLYVGAENNVFYAVNADTGAIIWSNSSLGSPITANCGDLPNGQFGITGTATYDRTAGLVYVADANDYVHALSMSTGAEQWNTNALYDPNTNTTVGAPAQDHIYSALTLNGSTLYVSTAGFCDIAPWHGRIVAIDTTSHNVTAAFFPGRTGSGKTGAAYCGGGIWGMGGASVDSSTNDVYETTGNIETSATGGCAGDASGETYPYGDAVIQLDPQLNLINFQTADITGNSDSDYGASAMLYSVPDCSSLQTSAKNKNGDLYTYSIGANGMALVQSLHVGNTTSNGTFVGVPAFNPNTGLVYVGNPNAYGTFAHGLNALQQSGGCTGLTLLWKANIGSASVTSDDNQAPSTANGVVYFTDGIDNQVWAFDASTGIKLWSSGTAIGAPCASYGLSCGVLGAPTIDGRLFVGAWNHKLYAFSL